MMVVVHYKLNKRKAVRTLKIYVMEEYKYWLLFQKIRNDSSCALYSQIKEKVRVLKIYMIKEYK